LDAIAGVSIVNTGGRADTSGWEEAWLNSASDPHLFVTKVMGYLPAGVPNPNGLLQLERWQDRFLKDFYLDPLGNVTDSPRHTVRSGHGVGKSTVIALLALWFPLTHYDSKTVITANSQDQLKTNNWAELRKQASNLPDALRGQIQIDEEKMYIKAAPEMAFVVRRTASKSNPEALAGIHANHVLYLIDEASGIDDIIFETAQGSLSTPGACAAMFSNPTRVTGFFYKTHTSLQHRWRTFHVSSRDVIRARGHIEDVETAYGKGSNKVKVRVDGDFPTQDDDTVIPLEWVRAAIDRDVVKMDYLPVWGLDVARFGDDRSALAKRQANRLLEPVKWWQGKDTMQLTGLVFNEYHATHEDMRPKEILVDVIGLGAGVVDRCRELGLPVRGINVAEANATDDRCMRLRDELWFKGRDWFETKDCSIPNDPALISELVVPTYDQHSSGRNVVESKKDMKKRVPEMGSPDIADAFLLTFAGSSYRKMPNRKGAPVRRDPWAA
jgi:phage terminase large subunit